MRYLRLLLLPLCPIWAFITQMRTELYLAGVLKRFIPSIPTIVVGNLSTGGTGKSPHTEYISHLLSSTYKTYILSRGYGRSTRGFLNVEKDSMASECGDEPLMMARHLHDVNVAVCESRREGIERIMKENPSTQVIVMDDAYQHLAVKASCYFMLTQFSRPFFGDYILPAGDLRELRMNASRAHCVVVSKTPYEYMNDSCEARERRELYKRYISRYSKAPVIFSRYKYSQYVEGINGERIDVDELKDYNVLLITGIATPTPLLEHLDGKGICYRHISFADHHTFSSSECEKIKNDFLNLPSGKNIILTTEKDMVRLAGSLVEKLPLYSLSITVEMNNEDHITMLRVIEQHTGLKTE
ncbi:MAG: tetraacyldisaccharide 4'-kinase [Flavobacteriales bacterium]|nr:tetraacyldisaccharide 4'-kinase [Flavobacteriales bacterium]